MTHNTIYVIDSFLILFAVMIARSREVKVTQVIIIAFAGYLFAMTPLSYPVWWTFVFAVDGLTGG
ncbi:hypothetical protein [Streptomyces sp. SCSIO ZS0520]|uniref:hypothetical protein n=1 Tax=Streptomyces sp. SCSIO ZS0520 TaxID=2892996 RepID=UPI0021D9823D|nr:hypothetical protein [Streptomyces sp. SCSIO ZS0520]